MTLPANKTVSAGSPDQTGTPAGAAQNTSGGPTPATDPAKSPRQLDQDHPAGVPGTSDDETARSPYDRDRDRYRDQDPRQVEDDRARAMEDRRKSHLEGLVVAHDNAVKEIDALLSQVSQGNSVTASQLTAIRNMLKGMHATAQGLSSGAIDPNAPGTAGQ